MAQVAEHFVRVDPVRGYLDMGSHDGIQFYKWTSVVHLQDFLGQGQKGDANWGGIDGTYENNWKVSWIKRPWIYVTCNPIGKFTSIPEPLILDFYFFDFQLELPIGIKIGSTNFVQPHSSKTTWNFVCFGVESPFLIDYILKREINKSNKRKMS